MESQAGEVGRKACLWARYPKVRDHSQPEPATDGRPFDGPHDGFSTFKKAHRFHIEMLDPILLQLILKLSLLIQGFAIAKISACDLSSYDEGA